MTLPLNQPIVRTFSTFYDWPGFNVLLQNTNKEVKVLTTITPADFAILKSLLNSEIARNNKNPTSYYSNLFQRALDIVSEHIDNHAKRVESEKVYHGY